MGGSASMNRCHRFIEEFIYLPAYLRDS